MTLLHLGVENGFTHNWLLCLNHKSQSTMQRGIFYSIFLVFILFTVHISWSIFLRNTLSWQSRTCGVENGFDHIWIFCLNHKIKSIHTAERERKKNPKWLKTVSPKRVVTIVHCMTISGHFLANRFNIFHKTEALLVILN